MTDRPPEHLLALPEIMIGSTPGIRLCSLIFDVRDFIFWLNAVHPYNIRPFKSRGPAMKLIIDPRTTQQPTANFNFSLK